MYVERKPRWIRLKARYTKELYLTSNIIHSLNLHTVCEEARCPNIFECWSRKTATFMILGDICTRRCKFCSVKTGDPKGLVDHDEPYRVALAAKKLNLKYIVITSVDRDDLADGGASQYAETIKMVRKLNPDIIIEVLIPDFQGNIDSLKIVVDEKPDVIGHNIETVKRLTSIVRDKRAGYELSLTVLKNIKRLDPSIYTKSGLMLGLGETYDEVIEALRDLRKAEVDIVTIGQYLMPSKDHFPVKEYVHPKIFKALEKEAYKMGFKYVASAPRVRSSYLASEYFINRILRK